MEGLLVFIFIFSFSAIATAQKSGDVKIEPYIFTTNDGQKIEAEFGRIYVPEKHAKSNGKLIELAFVRFKSTVQNPSFPIVYLAGGPGGSPDFPFPEVCTAWGNLKLDAGFRRPVKSNVKVLFLSGTFDGRTPPQNAEEILKGFPNGRHVLIEGAGHGDDLFISSPKIKDVMLEFMRDVPLSTQKITLPKIRFQPLS